MQSLADIFKSGKYDQNLPTTVNPFAVPCVIDFKASPDFSTGRINSSPAITKTRGSTQGYWCSTKGGPLSVSDMMKLQGFSHDVFPGRAAGLSESGAGGCLGNAQTLLLVRDLLPHLLWCSNQITRAEFDACKNFNKVA